MPNRIFFQQNILQDNVYYYNKERQSSIVLFDVSLYTVCDSLSLSRSHVRFCILWLFYILSRIIFLLSLGRVLSEWNPSRGVVASTIQNILESFSNSLPFGSETPFGLLRFTNSVALSAFFDITTQVYVMNYKSTISSQQVTSSLLLCC